MPTLQLLAPPYLTIGWSGREPVPPLGTVAVCDAGSPQMLSGSLRPLLQRAPWCVPCLVATPATSDPRVLVAIHELPGQPAFMSSPSGDGVAEAMAAVQSRPTPGGMRLAEYVVWRTGRPEFRSDLMHLLSPEPPGLREPIVPARTLRDRLRRFGQLTPQCWRAVGALCRIAAQLGREPVSTLAWRAGIVPRTLRAWTKRYLGVPVPEYRALVGWEWVMESALRVAGYADSSAPVPLLPPANELPLNTVILPVPPVFLRNRRRGHLADRVPGRYLPGDPTTIPLPVR